MIDFLTPTLVLGAVYGFAIIVLTAIGWLKLRAAEHKMAALAVEIRSVGADLRIRIERNGRELDDVRRDVHRLKR